MTGIVRIAAVIIAAACVVDPAIALRRRAPLPVELRLPESGDPGLSEAERVKASLLAAAGDAVTIQGSDAARAIVAIGNAVPEASAGIPVFALAAGPPPRLAAVSSASGDAVFGQQQRVSVRYDARGLSGRTTEFALLHGEAQLAAATHRWTSEQESFDARFDFVAPRAGLEVFRVTARTDGVATVPVDVAIDTVARKLRVFVYEPRPSWTAGFVRQALEQDPVFEVEALARTSRGIVTRTPRGPDALAALATEKTDVIAVGGLELLTDADRAALVRFAAERGGSVLLLPDGRLPEPLRSVLDLPQFDEVLVERPLDVRSGAMTFRASELLLPRGNAPSSTVADVLHAGLAKPVVTAFPRGAGQVLVSGALDAWRFRADNGDGFARFWRGAVADAALRAAPPLALEVEPRVVRPDQRVTVRAAVRESEWTHEAVGIHVPAVSASVIGPGTSDFVRMWPGAAPGVYEAHLAAPPPGRYAVRLESGGTAVESAFVVDASGATVSPDRSAAWARLAEASGGAAFDSVQPLAKRLRGMDAPAVEYTARPMRSPWWFLSFVGLLTIEWTLRRRGGRR